MTVTIRPVPSRVAGNRIVPFGRVQYTYKPKPVGLRDWKPPVPEPLKPAPLLGLGTLALLGLQALAWAWGLLNPTRRRSPAPGNVTLPKTELRYQPGVARSYTGINRGRRSAQLGGGIFTTGWYTGSVTPGNSGVPYTDREPEFFWRQPEQQSSGSNGTQNFPALQWFDPRDGQTKLSYLNSAFFVGEQEIIIRPSTGDSATWLPLSDGSTTEGLDLPDVVPDPEPAATPPAPLPLPLPSTVPQVEPSTEPDTLPAPSPLVPITPGPVAPPIIRPATPISPQQPKAPAPIATNNGIVVAPAPVPVPTTPQDAIYPVPGGLPVTGRTMTPTIQAVAQEVGRIEQKIDRMLNPVEGQWGDATDRLQLLWTLLRDLFNALTDGAPAGKYELSSPCVVDENGDRIIYETEWPEQGTNHGAILARVDAIAALLQTHKDLKQPNCHIPPVAVGGEFVTVNFEQID